MTFNANLLNHESPKTMKDKTLWTNKEAKWKPRNMQAVRMTFPAKGLHLPPPEPTINVLEQRKAEAEHRRIKAEKAAADLAAHRKEQEAKQKRERDEQRAAAKEKRRNLKPRNLWLSRLLKQKAKREGKPAPTNEELKAAQQAYVEGRLALV